MNQENLIKIISGSAKIAKNTAENLRETTSHYIKEKVLKNEFVTREEFTELRNFALKLSEELENIKQNSLNKEK
jgi:hypothetical protein